MGILQVDLGPYPGAPYMKRGLVRVRDWMLPHPGYMPVEYTAPDVLNSPDGDPPADMYVH